MRVFCFQGGVCYFNASRTRGLFDKSAGGGAIWTGIFLKAAGAAIAARGKNILAFADEKDGERRRKPEHGPDAEAQEKPPQRSKRAAPEIGNALKSAYQQTVNEDIPPEMLDLLGKLG